MNFKVPSKLQLTFKEVGICAGLYPQKWTVSSSTTYHETLTNGGINYYGTASGI